MSKYNGRWMVTGDDFWLRIEEPPSTVYTGKVNAAGTHIEGTMRNDNNASGCWHADKIAG